jgi:hypothetical protein
MPPPIVVQGTAVSNPHAPPATANAYAAASPAPTNFAGKGETQETRCRDPIFAVLLYANVIAIVAVAFTYGPDAVSSNSSNVEYEGYVIATIISALLSLVLAALGLLILMAIPETLIKVSLIFVVIMAGVWAALAFLSGSVFAGIMGIIFFAISICYARAVWSRIPFATINLVTACTAIKANWGVVGYAYIFTALAGLWSVAWAVAFVGVYDQTYTCDDVTNQCTDVNYGYLFLLFVAYFFTHQVLQVRNVMVGTRYTRTHTYIYIYIYTRTVVHPHLGMSFMFSSRTRFTSPSPVWWVPGGLNRKTLPAAARLPSIIAFCAPSRPRLVPFASVL